MGIGERRQKSICKSSVSAPSECLHSDVHGRVGRSKESDDPHSMVDGIGHRDRLAVGRKGNAARAIESSLPRCAVGEPAL